MVCTSIWYVPTIWYVPLPLKKIVNFATKLLLQLPVSAKPKNDKMNMLF